ncbi:F0F1 ATP synthase subunit epsilon [Micrococcales bacterium 31B]|nr:F0F1 ATP synthase subunit epsilon [Micrococcales bacterium 31B]
MSTLQVDIVAEDQTIWSGEAVQVVVPSITGEMGILPRMAPTLAVLRQGEVRVKFASGDVKKFDVLGGFVSVDNSRVTIPVDSTPN